MARARLLKPGFFLNEDLAELPPLTRILFAGLWCIADRAGRLEDRPKRIKHETLPYDEADVDALLAQLHNAGFILRYDVAGARYIQVVNFAKHQSPHIHEAQSVIPASGQPSDDSDTSTVQAPYKHDTSTPYPNPISNPIAVPNSETVDTSSPDDVMSSANFVADADASSDVQSAPAPEDVSPTPEQSASGAPTPPSKPRRSATPVATLDGEPLRLATLLRDSILNHTSDARVPDTPARLQSWAHVIESMLRLDRRAPPDIEAVIAFAMSDTFWRGNILSPGSLRDKYDQINIKRKTQAQTRQEAGSNGKHAENGRHAGPYPVGGRSPGAAPARRFNAAYYARAASTEADGSNGSNGTKRNLG